MESLTGTPSARLACATVVVGWNRGGIPEVLAHTGYLVDPEDIESFAHALSETLTNVSRRRELGQLAYQRALQTFDWKMVAGSWIELLYRASEKSNCM